MEKASTSFTPTSSCPSLQEAVPVSANHSPKTRCIFTSPCYFKSYNSGRLREVKILTRRNHCLALLNACLGHLKWLLPIELEDYSQNCLKLPRSIETNVIYWLICDKHVSLVELCIMSVYKCLKSFRQVIQ